jgi:serine/threonine protein kinase
VFSPCHAPQLLVDGEARRLGATMTGPTNRASLPLADAADPEYRARLQRALGADYQLGALLGQGGMGAVYVARDSRLDREVAVKALRHDVFPTPLVLERFQREAKALATRTFCPSTRSAKETVSPS